MTSLVFINASILHAHCEEDQQQRAPISSRVVQQSPPPSPRPSARCSPDNKPFLWPDHMTARASCLLHSLYLLYIGRDRLLTSSPSSAAVDNCLRTVCVRACACLHWTCPGARFTSYIWASFLLQLFTNQSLSQHWDFLTSSQRLGEVWKCFCSVRRLSSRADTAMIWTLTLVGWPAGPTPLFSNLFGSCRDIFRHDCGLLDCSRLNCEVNAGAESRRGVASDSPRV